MKLTKEQEHKRDDLVAKLQEAAGNLDDAVAGFNNAYIEAQQPVEDARQAYNTVLAEARQFAEDMATQIEEDIGEMSEKWQQSDRGNAANDWQSEWANIDMDELEIEYPDELEVDLPAHAEELEAIAADPLEGIAA